MKQTEQFSVGGYAFTLEKDASAALQEYIGALEKHYLSQDGGKEIMEGIEERVAELLLDQCGRTGVVTLGHVQSVISVIGRPEKIEADDPGTKEEQPGNNPRRLFRDLENKRLGGVCAGLAAYLQIDVTFIRLIFAVLAVVGLVASSAQGVFVVTVPFIYALLWVCMPAARTAQDRWSMHGTSVTADEISRNIQAGIEEIGSAAREVGNSDFFRKFGRFIMLAVGIGLLIIGTSGLASVSVISLNGVRNIGLTWQMMADEMVEELPMLNDYLNQPWVIALIGAAVLLPFVGILYGGIQLIFDFKSPSWKPGLVIFVLWLMVLVALGVTFFTGIISSEQIIPFVFD
jgi:phage shock protein PspC (stress-responsive transcriptional regulator)